MTDNEDTIRRGRARVRLIEAAQVLLKQTVDKRERITLEESRVLVVREFKLRV